MKKSYHSKIVPAEDAAMTRRMSFALSSAGAAAADGAIVAVALMAAVGSPPWNSLGV
jgi:hypothetical protein